MTRIIIKKIIWDEHNQEHIKKHNVSGEEIKEASGHLLYHKRSYKKRYLAIGRSGTRLVAMVIHKETKGYYLVTARDADKKERKKAYEKEKQNTRF